MKALPDGWRMVRLDEVADSALGKMLDKGVVRGHGHVPYLRNVNVQWGRIDVTSVHTMELADDERERFAVQDGDLLVCEGGEIGRAAIWRGSGEYIAYQKALHRVRGRGQVEPLYLRYLFEHYAKNGTLERYSTGSTIAHLPQQRVKALPVPLPHLIEQRRIVDILEDHLSRLDAADDYLAASRRRVATLGEQSIAQALLGRMGAGSELGGEPIANYTSQDGQLAELPRGWSWQRLGELADVVGGVTKDAKRQTDPTFVEVPYLRVANVQRGRLDLATVARIRVPLSKANALRLQPGDVLLNEGGDRDKLARGWVWEGQIDDCIHQNHVFRARVRGDVIDPRLLSWAANTIGGKWAERNGKQSVNLASISLSKIREMPVPLPPRETQAQLVDAIQTTLEAATRLKQVVQAQAIRSAGLRRALLAAAFSGRLTGGTSDIDRVEELAAAGATA